MECTTFYHRCHLLFVIIIENDYAQLATLSPIKGTVKMFRFLFLLLKRFQVESLLHMTI